jgi:putative acetyltransferase
MTPDSYVIREDDLSSETTQALLALHLAGMHASSPPGAVFALDLSGLRRPEITVWSVWQGHNIAGIGALKDLGDQAGELKSMRTHPDYLRRGVATHLLQRLIAEAGRRGLRRLSLETGTGPSFEAACALYTRFGFRTGDAFAGYEQSAFNQFLHLRLR